jgi:hypothetical protein
MYFWADGVRVDTIGATPEGKKQLVGLIDGVRESVILERAAAYLERLSSALPPFRLCPRIREPTESCTINFQHIESLMTRNLAQSRFPD